MLISDSELFQLLLEAQLIPEDKLKALLEKAHQEKIHFYEAILGQDLISDEQLGRLTADFLRIPFIVLSKVSIDDEILKIIPELVAKKQKIIAFKKDKQGLHLAMADSSNLQILEFVRKKAGLPVIVYLATNRDINNALALYVRDVKKAFDEIVAENIIQVKGAVRPELPIIKIVNTFIMYAYQNKASDIHIEPLEKNSLVRFRIDGILHDVIKLSLDIHPLIVTRIKVIAKLRTDEHQAAQDGKIRWRPESASDQRNNQCQSAEKLDIRVSIVPITNGEKVVMRLLSEREGQLSLADLGLTQTNLEKVKQAYKKPHGMILATGPTGCGKTTTIYVILKILNRREVNIMTIEDPVEYDIQGINQIQVNPKAKLTFASGLRSIVRQDPNIILVGEIRDDETAGIAINAAMTGHLVLSTLHTNDAATAIPRLLDMKIEPFLAASTVNIIIAQRLVRKICQKCRMSIEIKNEKPKTKNTNQISNINRPKNNQQFNNVAMKQSNSAVFTGISSDFVRKHFKDQETIRVYKGKGCPVCHQTGYTGRIGIFETLVIDNEIRQAIISRRDAAVIRQIAIKNGMKTMIEDGLEKAKQGITTIEEVIRVTKE